MFGTGRRAAGAQDLASCMPQPPRRLCKPAASTEEVTSSTEAAAAQHVWRPAKALEAQQEGLTRKVRRDKKSLTEAQADSKAAPGTRLWLMSSHWSTCDDGGVQEQQLQLEQQSKGDMGAQVRWRLVPACGGWPPPEQHIAGGVQLTASACRRTWQADRASEPYRPLLG